MKVTFIDEPELEFGHGGTHVDIRFGLMQHGPLDLGEATAPTHLRVGLVGTQESIDAVRGWLERCRNEVAAKTRKNRQPRLFPRFPGFSMETPFGASIVFHDRWCSPIRQREVDAILADEQPDEAVKHAVELFLHHAADVMEQGGPMVIVCAPPKDLLAAVDAKPPDPADAIDEELDEGSETTKGGPKPLIRFFHDVLKAEGMRLGVPIQMVRPQTYTGRQATNRWGESKPLQDEATRAWNIHVALYYKAGGIPWRLLRNPSELQACFVGVSFFRSLEGDRLLTSVAQVFNELGEGIIVKGPATKIDKSDPIPHLSSADAHALLKSAIRVYRNEHKTSPARVVLHKTSPIAEEEYEGFKTAAADHQIDSLDVMSVRRSFTRLFREATYPPLRGTFFELQATSGLVYLRGSVKFFETYPGMYVPRPIEFTVKQAETGVLQLGTEMMLLSKLNWNNTQFDGGEPITVRAARRVGDILKCVPEGGVLQPSFRFYM